jgi:hypothetical protein
MELFADISETVESVNTFYDCHGVDEPKIDISKFETCAGLLNAIKKHVDVKLRDRRDPKTCGYLSVMSNRLSSAIKFVNDIFLKFSNIKNLESFDARSECGAKLYRVAETVQSLGKMMA